MKNDILCSTDFSPSCRTAASVAAALTARLGGSLTLAHVAEYPETGGPEVSQYLENAIKSRLHSEAERLRGTGVEVNEVVLRGSVYASLAALATESTPFAIVAAPRTKTGALQRWLLGSVTERLVQVASVPTLIIRDASALEAWLAGRRALRIFVAADLSSSSNAPLLWVGELSRLAPCEITVGYLNWIPDETIRFGVKGPLAFSANPPELHSLLTRDLREKARAILGNVSVDVWVEPRWGRADLPSIEMANRNQADLLVVGSRRAEERRLFDGSVSRGILHHAPHNVAIVPTSPTLAAELPLTPVRRVLVATDFSDLGNVAISHAYSLLLSGGIIRLLHVKCGPSPDTAELTAQLRSLIPVGAADRGIETEIAVVENRQTEEAICQSAAQFGADIICLSTHGRSGLTQDLLGSVAQAVVARDDRPVLLIPRPS
jgi:nucleotide-binding universal stress UspA family protein